MAKNIDNPVLINVTDLNKDLNNSKVYVDEKKVKLDVLRIQKNLKARQQRMKYRGDYVNYDRFYEGIYDSYYDDSYPVPEPPYTDSPTESQSEDDSYPVPEPRYPVPPYPQSEDDPYPEPEPRYTDSPTESQPEDKNADSGHLNNNNVDSDNQQIKKRSLEYSVYLFNKNVERNQKIKKMEEDVCANVEAIEQLGLNDNLTTLIIKKKIDNIDLLMKELAVDIDDLKLRKKELAVDLNDLKLRKKLYIEAFNLYNDKRKDKKDKRLQMRTLLEKYVDYLHLLDNNLLDNDDEKLMEDAGGIKKVKKIKVKKSKNKKRWQKNKKI